MGSVLVYQSKFVSKSLGLKVSVIVHAVALTEEVHAISSEVLAVAIAEVNELRMLAMER